MKRQQIEMLSTWLTSPRRKPLVIRGARQVGKSTLVKEFAREQKLDLVEVNLEKHPALKNAFASMDAALVLKELEYATGSGKINQENRLLFLDEIQVIPEAVQCLRYFLEEAPSLPVISAGSLLEFALEAHDFSMPVGRVEYLFMGPCSFEEFLNWLGHDDLLQLIGAYNMGETFPLTAHRKLTGLLREYLMVGGMPEALSIYQESEGDLSSAARIQSSIIETYRDDFPKYSGRIDVQSLQKVYDYAPTAVGEKLKYSNIDPKVRAATLSAALRLLAQAQVLTVVNHSAADGIPLRAHVNEEIFKIYCLDCGLMNRMCGATVPSLDALLSVQFINSGKMAEQFIAQHLLYQGESYERPMLFYWLREGKTGNAEIDFVIEANHKVVPVEVKSGEVGAMKSLGVFANSKGTTLALRFDMNSPSLQAVKQKLTDSSGAAVSFQLLSLPLYMVQQSRRLLAQVMS